MGKDHNCYENVAACWSGSFSIEIFCAVCGDTAEQKVSVSFPKYRAPGLDKDFSG